MLVLLRQWVFIGYRSYVIVYCIVNILTIFNVCVIPSFTSSILIKIESRTFKIFSLKCLPKKQFKHVLWDTEMAKGRRGEGGNETTDILVV